MKSNDHLTLVYKNAKRIKFDDNSRIVLMSDCHRGTGLASDNFVKNQNICFCALQNYYNKGFTYFELGDGDELWENSSILEIINSHADVFQLLSKFYRESRFYSLWGNHDIVKEDKNWVEENLSYYKLPHIDKVVKVFPKIDIQEGIVLKHEGSGGEIFLVHGHQVDFINSYLWRLSAFLVKYLWRPLELLGIKNPFSTSDNAKRKLKVENKLISWCKTNKKMMIAGHTHRPVMPDIGQPLYFNDGCCVHLRSITALEIFDGEICLVKWCLKTRESGNLFVAREVLNGPKELRDYFENIDV